MAQALYRRYRPESFEEIIGQDHVTGPLQQALRSGRINHAYLFSGPRGCGKTTSARILARALNCTAGPEPTPTPCGVCDSCVSLARNGPGSLDVIEIDAASHGGVDEARDLRERAFYAPASSRYKVYVVDEAHMVTPQGFNALLKIVEEPPEHVVFVFATTEPDKVIGTIRSRTHHYPFRLVPPGQLLEHLARVCAQEGVAVQQGVLPMVVRAGRGSVRDAMSVLDQLIAGSGEEGLTCALSTALLGYTDAALLDDTVEALAAGDGGAVFTIIDRVVEAGHDPRRFAEDLLERLRDLLVLDAIGDAASAVLRDAPADQVERMRQQAARFGSAALSRAADLVSIGLTEMRGATAPRLQLELICARVLLPSADDDPRSLQARFDRLERRLSIAGGPPSTAPPTVPIPAGVTRARPAVVPSAAPDQARPVEARPVEARAVEAHLVEIADAQSGDARFPGTGASDAQPPDIAPAEAPPADLAQGTGFDATALRRSWPDIVERVRAMRRVTWTLISSYASVVGVEGHRLVLGFSNAQMRENFDNGTHPELLRQAIIDVLGADLRVEAIVDPSATSDSASSAGRPAQAQPAGSVPLPPPPDDDDGWGPPPAAGGGAGSGAAAQKVAKDAASDAAPGARSDAPPDPGPDPSPGGGRGAARRAALAASAARAGSRASVKASTASGTDWSGTVSGGIVASGTDPRIADGDAADPNGEASDQDENIDLDLTGADLLKRELGASVLRQDMHS